MRKVIVLSLLILVGISFSSLATVAGSTSVTIDNPAKAEDIKGLIDLIANAVLGIIGSVAVIMLVIAGILFLTSAGQPERFNTAKACLMYAIIGIAVALGAKALAGAVEKIFI